MGTRPLSYWFLLALSLSGCTCKQKEKPEDLLSKAAVDTTLAMVPPIARDVLIRQVKDDPAGNLLLTADFGPGVIKGAYHAVQLSDGKAVLRDDGKGGDAKAGDGVFSIVLREDINEVGKQLAAAAERIKRQG